MPRRTGLLPGLSANVPGEAIGGDLGYPGKKNENGISNKILNSISFLGVPFFSLLLTLFL